MRVDDLLWHNAHNKLNKNVCTGSKKESVWEKGSVVDTQSAW